MNIDTSVVTPLCKIMGDHGSDKGHENIMASRHNYTQVYHALFEPVRQGPLRVFELGLGTNNIHVPSNMGPYGRPGASLRGWVDYFPNARVFGADIDKDILFQTDRIRTFYCDQTDPKCVRNMWKHPDLLEPFHIIVEDGLHTMDANVCFFENSVHKLHRGGCYIIEDITRDTLDAWDAKLTEWRKEYPDMNFQIVRMDKPNNDWDNNLIVITKQL